MVDLRGHDGVQAPAAVHRLGSCGGQRLTAPAFVVDVAAPGYAYDIPVICPICPRFSISRIDEKI